MTDTHDRIACSICGAHVHSIQIHLKNDHADWSLDRYRSEFPEAPLLSAAAIKRLEEKKKETEKATAPKVTGDVDKMHMHEVFAVGKSPAAMAGNGNPISIHVFKRGDFEDMIPDVDGNYVYELENLKNSLLAFELNIPLYIWGHAGTGKTTLVEQVCARTNRPALRIQHTISTEESQIVGQWTARGGETIFELGPLALAMKHGWVYIADEYDFALPSVLSVYQPVLEGKALVIKEADAANRVIKPHPNFRFVATGNTNGSGDDTGLYQGTQVQNAANYDRFRVVLEAKYMEPKLESKILVGQAGIVKTDADKMVDFANRVREAYDGQKISLPISPRTLITAAQIGIAKGSFRAGINLAYANKLSKVDKATVDSLAQRIFG